MKALLLRSAMGAGIVFSLSFTGCVTITTTNPAPTYTPPPAGYVQASNVERCPAACCQAGYAYAPQPYGGAYPQPASNPQAGAYPPAQYPQPYPAQYPQPYPAYPQPYPAQYPQPYPAYPYPAYPQPYPAQYPQPYPSQDPVQSPRTADGGSPMQNGSAPGTASQPAYHSTPREAAGGNEGSGGSPMQTGSTANTASRPTYQSTPREAADGNEGGGRSPMQTRPTANTASQPTYHSTPRVNPVESADDRPRQDERPGARPDDAGRHPVAVVRPTPAARTDDRVTPAGTPGATPHITPRTTPARTPAARGDERVDMPVPTPRVTLPAAPRTADRITTPTPIPAVSAPRQTTEQADASDPKKNPAPADLITNGGTKVSVPADTVQADPAPEKLDAERSEPTKKTGTAAQN